MKKILFSVLLCAASRSSARAAAPMSVPSGPDALIVRAVAWDASSKPGSDKEWNARAAAEIASAVKAGADVVVFPESLSKERSFEPDLPALKDAAKGSLVVIGNSPHREPDGTVFSRAYILAGGAWQAMDKLDPTPAERAQKPPVLAGMRLILFRYRGGLVAALPSFSIQKTEYAAALKKRGVNLVLVSAPAEDEEGAARLARCASARAVEIGAAVVVAPPSPVAPALYLPAQKGFDLKPATPAGRDFRVPWKRLLDLRVIPRNEASPFLEPAAPFQTEI